MWIRFHSLVFQVRWMSWPAEGPSRLSNTLFNCPATSSTLAPLSTATRRYTSRSMLRCTRSRMSVRTVCCHCLNFWSSMFSIYCIPLPQISIKAQSKPHWSAVVHSTQPLRPNTCTPLTILPIPYTSATVTQFHRRGISCHVQCQVTWYNVQSAHYLRHFFKKKNVLLNNLG
jgi:mRNA-degrading endonuclease toxin of MazEF toxin-antitoxin module